MEWSSHYDYRVASYHPLRTYPKYDVITRQPIPAISHSQFFQSDHHRPSTPGSWKKPPMRAQSTSQLHLTPFPSSYSGFPARVPVQTLVFQPPPYSALVELRSPRTSYYDVASPVSCSCQAVSPVSRKSAPLLSAVSKCSQDSEHDNGSPCYKEAPPLPKCPPPPLIFGQPLLVIPRQKTPHEKERGGSGRRSSSSDSSTTLLSGNRSFPPPQSPSMASTTESTPMFRSYNQQEVDRRKRFAIIETFSTQFSPVSSASTSRGDPPRYEDSWRSQIVIDKLLGSPLSSTTRHARSYDNLRIVNDTLNRRQRSQKTIEDDLSASWTHPSMNMDCSRRNTRQASFVAAVSAGNGKEDTVFATPRSQDHLRSRMPLYVSRKGSKEEAEGTRLVRKSRDSRRRMTMHGELPRLCSVESAECIESVRLHSLPQRASQPLYAWSREEDGHLTYGTHRGLRGGVELRRECAREEEREKRDHKTLMRRQRPKSYVLATSSSFPAGEAETRARRGRSPLGRNRNEEFKEDHASSESITPYNGRGHANTQRLHKFIALFSHHQDGSNKDTAATPRVPVKRSRTAHGRDRVPLVSNGIPPPPVPAKCVAKQGQLVHQRHNLNERVSRKSSSREDSYGNGEWKQCWAVLTGHQLFLCKQLSSYIADATSDKMLSIPVDAICIDVQGALTDIAYECLRNGKRNVFRLVSQKRVEHLLQADGEDDMLDWIERVQSASAFSQKENTLNGALPKKSAEANHSVAHQQPLPATTQLIMHRYKAKSSQLGSPLSSKRPSSESTSTPVMVAPAGASVSSVSSSSSSRVAPAPSSTGAASAECNGGSAQGSESGGGTPKSGRRWKRGKGPKAGSGSQSSGERPGPSYSAFGSKITDCPTGGDGDLVPMLVQVCVRVVESHGMDTVGIYRIPGNTAAVNALKEALNDGFDNIDYNDARWKDVNVVSSLLKMFLRKLPEPLLTDKLYPFFIDANRITNHHTRLHKLRNLLRKLPRAHYMTLKFIIGHLSSVTRHSDVNKMETRNLSLMFGPSIVRPSDDSMATMVTHMSDQCKIIETFVNYFDWIFDETGTSEDTVPPQLPGDIMPLPQPGCSTGLDNPPPGVSSSSFNDMHSLIIRANEEQAVAMMKENDKGKIKTILNVRRNSRRDKSKTKWKIESTAPGAMNPLPSSYANYTPSTAPSAVPTPSAPPTASHSIPLRAQPVTTTASRCTVDSVFCGNYQERDIDAEIALRRIIAPVSSAPDASEHLVHSPSQESCLSSMPDTTRSDCSEASEQRRRRYENMSSARRIFIAGSEAAASASLASDSSSVMDALTSHTQHLHLAASPALEVYSLETREKIRKMQMLGASGWKQNEKITPSPTKEDALSFTSDYSTTSSAPVSQPIGVSVPSEGGGLSSDYASSDVSPCARNASASPRVYSLNASSTPSSTVASDTTVLQRPQQLPVALVTSEAKNVDPTGGTHVISRSSMHLRRDPARRHTLSDVHTLRDQSPPSVSFGSGRFQKLTRWFKLGIRKSSPDVRSGPVFISTLPKVEHRDTVVHTPAHVIQNATPPDIVRTSPNELTPASDDELL